MSELEELQKKLAVMQKIKELQEEIGVSTVSTNGIREVKHVKVPEARYNMSLADYRTYKISIVDQLWGRASGSPNAIEYGL